MTEVYEKWKDPFWLDFRVSDELHKFAFDIVREAFEEAKADGLVTCLTGIEEITDVRGFTVNKGGE